MSIASDKIVKECEEKIRSSVEDCKKRFVK